MLEISMTTLTHVKHVIHVKDTPHETNQILKSLHDYRNT